MSGQNIVQTGQMMMYPSKFDEYHVIYKSYERTTAFLFLWEKLENYKSLNLISKTFYRCTLFCPF